MASHVLTLPGLRRCGSASASDSAASPASTASAASGLGSAASAAVLPVEQNRQRSRPWSTNIHKAFTSFTFSFKSSFGPSTCLTRSNTTRLKKKNSWDVPDVPGLRWHHLRDLPSWLTIQRAPCVLAALSTPGIWRTGGPEDRRSDLNRQLATTRTSVATFAGSWISLNFKRLPNMILMMTNCCVSTWSQRRPSDLLKYWVCIYIYILYYLHIYI